MATLFDRFRDGLIWSYAALTLVEERHARGQRWWEQENIRFKEDARARLDATLQQLEERRLQRSEWISQRTDWMKDRMRAGLSESGLVSSDQLTTLQERIDALAARVSALQEQLSVQGASTAHIILPDGSTVPGPVAAPESGAPSDATPTS